MVDDGTCSFIGTPSVNSFAPSRLARQAALFVCTRNSARSQLAAALWASLTQAPAESAGTHPAHRVHPGAVRAGQRAGFDLAGATPRSLADVTIGDRLVVTVCDQAHEELEPAPTWLHWSIDDPVEAASTKAFDRTVTELRQRISLTDRSLMTDRANLPETGTGSRRADLQRRLVAEAFGTGMLTVAVIGSGIMASRLSPDDIGLQLLENAAATAAALIGLILIFGAVSGAHFNPVVTLVDRANGDITTRDAAAYVAAQVVGGCLGAIVANVMFGLPAIDISETDRASGGLWLSEIVATIGLLLVINGCVRSDRADVVAFAVGLWIGGAYWFTSSTSFANPAVTIARTLSDSFAGIAPSSVPMFIAMQLVGAALAFLLVRYLYPRDGGDPSGAQRHTRSHADA